MCRLPTTLFATLSLVSLLSAQTQGWQRLHQNSYTRGFFTPAFAYDDAKDRLLNLEGFSPSVTRIRTKGAWSTAGSLGTSYWVQGAAMTYDSKRSRFVLFGGQSSSWTSTSGWKRNTWEHDGTKWTMRSTSGPTFRRNAAAAYDPTTGRSYFFGGYYRSYYSHSYLNDLYYWSGTSWVNLTSGTRPSGRFDSAMTYDSARKRLVLFGGQYNVSSNRYSYADTWEFDGKTWTQIKPSSYPAARSKHVLAYDPIRKVTVLFGGSGTLGTWLNDTWEWNGKTWIKASPKTTPPSAAGQFLHWSSARKRMILVHSAQPVRKPEFWEWDGKEWTRQRDVTPPPLTNHAGAYDEARDRYVAFGGRSASLQNQTWEWNGSAFLPTQPTVTPPAREGASMVYSPDSKLTILFGGKKARSLANDTWTYNGSNWAPALFFKNPTPRSEHAMAYDRARKRLLVFGGNDGSKDLNDLWSLNTPSLGYKQIIPKTSPPARSSAAMVYDEARDRILLFGGRVSRAVLNDFWEFDGKDWKQLKPKTLPSPRYGHAMAYEPHLGRILLFGGSKAGSTNTQDAWIYTGTDWKPAPTTTSNPSTRTDAVLVFDTKRKRFLLHDGSLRGDLWSFTMTPTQAGLTPFGSGCGSPPVQLRAAPLSAPLLGKTFRALITSAPSNSAFGALALGASRTKFGPFTLPLKLDGLGLKGCQLYQSQDFLFAFLVKSGSGQASIYIPRLTPLIGITAYAQAFVKAPKANIHEVLLSNGGVFVIGNK